PQTPALFPYPTLFRSHRHADLGAVVQVEAAAHLLQAELRAGDEPADRLDSRGARHEPRVVHRAAAEYPRSGRHLAPEAARGLSRSEEHTSELHSRSDL